MPRSIYLPGRFQAEDQVCTIVRPLLNMQRSTLQAWAPPPSKSQEAGYICIVSKLFQPGLATHLQGCPVAHRGGHSDDRRLHQPCHHSRQRAIRARHHNDHIRSPHSCSVTPHSQATA